MTDAPRHAAPQTPEDAPQDSAPVEAGLPKTEEASAPVSVEPVQALDRHGDDEFDLDTPVDAQPDYDAEETEDYEEVVDEKYDGNDGDDEPESTETPDAPEENS